MHQSIGQSQMLNLSERKLDFRTIETDHLDPKKIKDKVKKSANDHKEIDYPLKIVSVTLKPYEKKISLIIEGKSRINLLDAEINVKIRCLNNIMWEKTYNAEKFPNFFPIKRHVLFKSNFDYPVSPMVIELLKPRIFVHFKHNNKTISYIKVYS